MHPLTEHKIRALRRDLHRHPELSGHETGTVKRLVSFLRENTSLEITEREGWFYALKRGTDPDAGSIAFRADMDALPIDEADMDLPHSSACAGVSHKCGHDGHCAALCALALELDPLKTRRNIYLIFQQAEEIGAGGQVCAQLLREQGIREVYAFHNLSGYPEGTVVYRRGLTQPASEGLTIRFHGRTSHAASPEQGLNPAECIARTALFSQKLLHRPYRGMVLCTIVGMEAGTGDFGISAGEGQLQLTLRAENEEEMRDLETEILAYARRQAEEAGRHRGGTEMPGGTEAATDEIAVDFTVTDYFPETRNSEQGIERVRRAAQELGIAAMEMQELWRASEDFGHYLKVCSGAMFYIGNGEKWPALHTKEYDFNDRILETAAGMFLQLAVS